MGVERNVSNTTKTFIAVLSLGLVGLLFLIIFGNLSGNLGFTQDSKAITVTNESQAWVNQTGYTLANSNSSTSSHVITAVWNATNSTGFLGGYNVTIILAPNYTVSTAGVLSNITTTAFENVSVSYTLNYATDSQGLADTNQVILNLTGGAVTFFGFSNVWFVLLAVTLLIIIVISVIKVVGGTGTSMKGEGSSTFPT